MKQAKITVNFRNYTDAQLESYGLAIVTALTGNAHFPDPQPTLDTVNATIKAFADALSQAQSRDKVKVSMKNDRRDELELILRHLAGYCHFVGKGDRTILISSGFSVNSDSTSTRILSSPANFTAQLGEQPGEVQVSVDPVAHAKGYVFLYGISPIEDDQWKHSIDSLPYAIITGLEAGKQYSFKMGVLGAKRQVAYTETITRMVV